VAVPLIAAPQQMVEPVRVAEALSDPARGRLVVVIDDDALVLDGMRGVLKSWGCDVVTAACDDAAITALAKHRQPPDLIISDYRLTNGKTGFEAIARLRSAIGAPIPAFLISGDTAPERLREASASGYHLLHKPVLPMTLRAVVNQLMKGKEDSNQRLGLGALSGSPTVPQAAADPSPAIRPQ